MRYFQLTRISRKYKFIGLILFIILFNKFIIQTVPVSDDYDKLIAINEDVFNNETEASCRLADDTKEYEQIKDDEDAVKHEECKNGDWVLIDDNGVCTYNYEYLNQYKLVIKNCYYSIINDIINGKFSDSSYRIENKKYSIRNGTILKTEFDFFYISCEAYKNNMNVIERNLFSYKYKTAYARILKPKSLNYDDFKLDTPINVLFLGLDSVSKIKFLKNMPKTSRYFIQNLNSSVLNAYNIIGDGTPAALIALLTGKYEHELPNTLKGTYDAHYVDQVYPFIWNNYSHELNYATLYAEDWPSIGTFNYRMIGMSNRPTTHYMRPFQLAIWNENMVKESSTLCLHERTRLQVMLDYTYDFMRQYVSNGFFGFTFLSEYTHDQSNHIKWTDEILFNFLKKFHNSKLSDNTILILFSDHGPRFSTIRSTIKGLLEERNPFFSIYFPPDFRQKYQKIYSNFIENRNRLITPFDIHETLKHLLKTLKGDKTPLANSNRSISLFNKIPENRTCNDASIDPHWCACLRRKKLIINDDTYRLANDFIHYVNNEILLGHDSKCSKLTIDKINNVYQLEASNSLRHQKNKPSSRVNNEYFFYRIIKPFIAPVIKSIEVTVNYEQYQIQLQTKPNLAIYEFTANVERNFKNPKEYKIYFNKALISRINKYGNQSICIHDKFPDLRKYCYCK